MSEMLVEFALDKQIGQYKKYIFVCLLPVTQFVHHSKCFRYG